MTGWLALVETHRLARRGRVVAAEAHAQGEAGIETGDAKDEGFFGATGIQDGFSCQPDSGFQVWPAASPERSGPRNRESLVIISGKSGT